MILKNLFVQSFLLLAFGGCCFATYGEDSLNQYLAEASNIATTSVEENVLKLSMLSYDMQGNPNHRYYHPDTLNVLDKVLRASSVSTNCDADEMETLKVASELTNAIYFHPHPEITLTPLEQILYKANQVHARLCMPRYQARFFRMCEEINNRTQNNFRTFVLNFASKVVQHTPVWNIRQYMKKLVEREPSLLELAYKGAWHVRFWSHAELNEAPFETRYHQYIKEPCKIYLSHFGSNLFELVLISEQMFESSDLAYDFSNEYLIPFFQALSGYKICRLALASPELEVLTLDLLMKKQLKLDENILAFPAN